ncbi:MAG: hypothetical protein J0G94_15420 [Sphingomonadales bacterium]|nr:hypothetical protein [Sphingomonadales bacterium]
MTDTAYRPLTQLEAAVRNAMAGTGDERDVLAALMISDICVPSAGEVQQDGTGLTPLLLQSKRFGSRMVVVLDDASRIGPEIRARARHALQVSGGWLIGSIAPDIGITLFVGPGIGCELSAELLASVRSSGG